MIKILLVEDNQEKLRDVLKGIFAIAGIHEEHLDKARDLQEAKSCLKQQAYDLMILDISLPTTSDVEPVRDGGLTLLEEILARDIYIKPREVVGLTAHADIQEEMRGRFDSELWSVLHYSNANVAWLDQIQRKIEHILQTNRERTSECPELADICVLTALHAPELTAVLKLPWDFQPVSLECDPTQYYRGHVSTKYGRLSVVAASASRMGMPAAAVLAMKMINTFRPSYIAMTGIAAGVPGKVELGDIIAADPSWDYGSGKNTASEAGSSFEAAPHHLNLDPFIRSKLEKLRNDPSVFEGVRRSWPIKIATPLSMHLGPLASGAAVLEDPTITSNIQAQHRKLLGVEMEAYGVFAAAHEAPHPQPRVIVLKSVCDFANPEKNDSSQDYAAFTSAQAFKLLVENHL
ncbi:phosphorylase family protein [Pseudomonas soli]|uniref:Response regulatory domain-containing protein n=1 Tax=Pseudomonas soli TaxID=1306993 RepID=A0A2V4HPH2_9PSED|nr:response regulator [Pseudomonas soli]PYB79858.1 hypothetical protein DMX07_15805 [Pseudomonas soli]